MKSNLHYTSNQIAPRHILTKALFTANHRTGCRYRNCKSLTLNLRHLSTNGTGMVYIPGKTTYIFGLSVFSLHVF